jgi:hypothetical protein
VTMNSLDVHGRGAGTMMTSPSTAVHHGGARPGDPRRDLGRSTIQGPLPDDDVLSAVAARIQRDIGLHHELSSASTTTSSGLLQDLVQWRQPDGGDSDGLGSKPDGLIWALMFFLF